MAIKPFPTLAVDLIDDIAGKYPPRCIARDESFEDHLRYSGAADVALWLKEWLDAANRLSKIKE